MDFNGVPHTHPLIVGLSGWATSGKDETANVLTRLYGYKRIAFADNIKRFVREIDPIVFFKDKDKDAVHVSEFVDGVGDREAKQNPEYRRLLQRAGVAAREYFGKEVWVNSALDGVSGPIVVTDVRFPNEYDKIHTLGGVIWRVVRPGVRAANDHPSEISLDRHKFDATVINDGNLTDLEGEVQRVLGDLG